MLIASVGGWLRSLAQLVLPLLAVLSVGKAAVSVPTARSRGPATLFPLLGSDSARAAPQPGLVLDSTPPGASGPHRAGEDEPGTQAPSHLRRGPEGSSEGQGDVGAGDRSRREEKHCRSAGGSSVSVMQIESLKLEESSFTPVPNHPGPLEVASEQAQG